MIINYPRLNLKLDLRHTLRLFSLYDCADHTQFHINNVLFQITYMRYTDNENC